MSLSARPLSSVVPCAVASFGPAFMCPLAGFRGIFGGSDRAGNTGEIGDPTSSHNIFRISAFGVYLRRPAKVERPARSFILGASLSQEPNVGQCEAGNERGVDGRRIRDMKADLRAGGCKSEALNERLGEMFVC